MAPSTAVRVQLMGANAMSSDIEHRVCGVEIVRDGSAEEVLGADDHASDPTTHAILQITVVERVVCNADGRRSDQGAGGGRRRRGSFRERRLILEPR